MNPSFHGYLPPDPQAWVNPKAWVAANHWTNSDAWTSYKAHRRSTATMMFTEEFGPGMNWLLEESVRNMLGEDALIPPRFPPVFRQSLVSRLVDAYLSSFPTNPNRT